MTCTKNLLKAAMTPLQRNGISFSIILILVNGCVRPTSSYSAVSKIHVQNFHTLFAQYSKIDSNADYQRNFTLCSFVGDFEGAIKYATKQATLQRNGNPKVIYSEKDKSAAEAELKVLLSDNLNNSPEKTAMINILSGIVYEDNSIQHFFKNRNIFDAKQFIIEQSIDYHFLLINEAHYSSQNRKFSTSLLKPLWDNGYRYLALETLDYKDDSLAVRRYPRLETGYYTKDAVFGNLVREALHLGYKLIPYEAKVDLTSSSTLRDREQALNIYNSTLRHDSVGKVLIHAGYSHISEFPGSDYEPMGFSLGQLAKQPILTIDQQCMTELNSVEAMNPYYVYCLDNYTFKNPVVFLDQQRNPLVDAINAAGIDIQIFHPRTTLKVGRPDWLASGEYKNYDLPEEILLYDKHLLQALTEASDPLEVPVDQLIIKPGTSLILKPGFYYLRIIDKDGTLVGIAELNAN